MQRNENPNIITDAFWHFIGGLKLKNKSVQETAAKFVERETGIKLAGVDFLSIEELDDTEEYFYSAKLTDDNVNNMERANGQILNFFTLRELENLPLAAATKLFISKHRDKLESEPLKN